MSTPELYPPEYFCLSQVYKSWVKLYSKDIYSLRRLPGYENTKVWHWLNHPIRYVELMGIIVGSEERSNFHVYDFDDSSGITIDLVVRSEGEGGKELVDKVVREKIDVGNLVRARGFVVQFRDLRQLEVIAIENIRDWNLEIKGWNERANLREKVLDKPWFIEGQHLNRIDNVLETKKINFKNLTQSDQTMANLKLLIWQHIESRNLHDFTISYLRSTPEIEQAARTVAKPSTSANVYSTLLQVLKSLIHDGNIIFENQVYIVIGEWNIGQVVNQQVAETKRKTKNQPNLTLRVSKIWSQVTGRGGAWQGVSKEIVSSIVQEMLLRKGKWKLVASGRWAYVG